MSNNLLEKTSFDDTQLASTFNRTMKDWQIALDWKNDDEDDDMFMCVLANLESDSYNLRRLKGNIEEFLYTQPTQDEVDHLLRRINQLEDCLKDHEIKFPDDDLPF